MKNKLQIIVKEPPGDGGKDGYDLFAVWKEYEAIAMHFNDLLLKIRTQSLAAIAAFATVAGVLLKGENINAEIRWGTLSVVFFALCVFWVAIWILDFAYYNRLLLGAVKALVWIERESKTENRTSGIYISTLIEQAVARRSPQAQAAAFDDRDLKAAILRDPAKREDFKLSWGRWTFYSLVFLLLVGLMIGSILQFRDANRRPRPAPNAATASSTPR